MRVGNSSVFLEAIGFWGSEVREGCSVFPRSPKLPPNDNRMRVHVVEITGMSLKFCERISHMLKTCPVLIEAYAANTHFELHKAHLRDCYNYCTITCQLVST